MRSNTIGKARMAKLSGVGLGSVFNQSSINQNTFLLGLLNRNSSNRLNCDWIKMSTEYLKRLENDGLQTDVPKSGDEKFSREWRWKMTLENDRPKLKKYL